MVIAGLAVAIMSAAISISHGAEKKEAVRELSNLAIPNVPGKRLVSVLVEYPPGVSSTPHRHARSAYIYAHVLAGRIRSQVDDDPVRVYLPGESWSEKPGAFHRVSANASDTEPAKLLAIFVVDAADEVLTTPVPAQ
jgi:quercetin dioxygenase-like cupin family protein